MMEVGELLWFMENYSRIHPQEYQLVKDIYQQWVVENSLRRVKQLIIPTVEGLRKYPRQYDYVDSAWTVAQRVNPNIMVGCWSPAVVMPKEAVEMTRIIRSSLNPDILTADVIKMLIENNLLSSVKGVEFSRTDPHLWATLGKLPRRSTIYAGFYAAIKIGLQTGLLER